MAAGARFVFVWLRRRAAAFVAPTPSAGPGYDLFWPGLAAMSGIDWPGEAEPIDWPGI